MSLFGGGGGTRNASQSSSTAGATNTNTIDSTVQVGVSVAPVFQAPDLHPLQDAIASITGYTGQVVGQVTDAFNAANAAVAAANAAAAAEASAARASVTHAYDTSLSAEGAALTSTGNVLESTTNAFTDLLKGLSAEFGNALTQTASTNYASTAVAAKSAQSQSDNFAQLFASSNKMQLAIAGIGLLVVLLTVKPWRKVKL